MPVYLIRSRMNREYISKGAAILIVIVANACTSRTAKVPEVFSPESLQGEWHMLTEQNGEQVLFYPCDADNVFIQVKGDSIIIGWGQDASAGKIEDWNKNVADNDISLAVNDSFSVNFYRVLKTEEGLTEWWLWEDAEKPALLVNAVNKSRYKEVRQPCKECWEDCDEEQ